MSQKGAPHSSRKVSIATAVDKKLQDSNCGKVWPRTHHRRESSINGTNKNEQKCKSIFQPQRDRFKGGNAKFVTADDNRLNDHEVGSVTYYGRKKQNLNHLLNFHFEERNVVGSINHSNWKQHNSKYKFNKEQFLLANCQFLVGCNVNPYDNIKDPDVMIDWNQIEQIVSLFLNEITEHILNFKKISSVGFLTCPICLYSPKAAKMTRCGHIYCWSCILHYLSLSDKSSRTCPICYQSINKKDLKSVISQEARFYSIGDHISFRLMERSTNSLNIVASRSFEENLSDIYSKFLTCTPTKILGIIEREKLELDEQFNEDPDCPEVCFIELAKGYLNTRETEIFNDISSISALDYTDYRNLAGDSYQTDKKCYFYQVIDGQHIFLHSLNMKMLEHCFGDVSNWPTIISGTVLNKDNLLINPEYRSRFKYLKHLPLNCNVEIIEIQFDPDIIHEDTFTHFGGQIEDRKQMRQLKADKEREHEERVAHNQLNKMKVNHGAYLDKTVHEQLELESDIQFPVVHSDSLSSSDHGYFQKKTSYAKTLSSGQQEFKSMVDKPSRNFQNQNNDSCVPDFNTSLKEALDNISLDDNLLTFHEGVTPKEKKQIHVLLSFKDGRSISSLDLHSDKNKVVIGNDDNFLTLYDIENKCIIFSKKLPFGNGRILGTIKRNGNLFCINEEGYVTNVDEDHVEFLMKTAEGLECFLELPTNQNHIAVAGNGCQVTLFDICTTKKIWKGKNPPNDELNIPLPIWISGMCYDNNTICTVSRHGIISGYDTRASTKPVFYFKDDLSSFTAVSKSFKEKSCLVGTNKGSLRLFEFRKSAIFSLNSYKSCVGCVSDIQCNELTSPMILASSLDRNLHIFNFDTKALIEQYYLRVRLRKLLVTETIVSFDDMDEVVPTKRIRIF